MSWAEKIIEKITPETQKPVVAVDPQKYLALPELQEQIKRLGFTLVFAEPTIEAHVKFELYARGKPKTILAVLGKYTPLDDIKAAAFVAELKPREFFPNFDERAIFGLDYKELCKLGRIQIFSELTFDETEKLVQEKIKRTSLEDEKQELSCLFLDLQRGGDFSDANFWFSLAPKIGGAGRLAYKLAEAAVRPFGTPSVIAGLDPAISSENFVKEYQNTLEKLNQKFQSFLDQKYESLFTRTGLKQPFTIDKVQDFIASNSKGRKAAFIVIDGMNLWQWNMLKTSLQGAGMNVEEKFTLSWLPSITAWARQSIFKGAKPDITINNSTEGDLFKHYWTQKQHKMGFQLLYKKVGASEKISVPESDVQVAGFVTNALDDLMHGNVLGCEELYLKTDLWIHQAEICRSVAELKSAGFDVYISTDHGNIDAKLCLKLSSGQKAVMNSRSKRFVQFDTDEQAENFIRQNQNYSLGKRGRCVYFRDTNAFGSSGGFEITHGGSHLLEMLIPVGIIKAENQNEEK